VAAALRAVGSPKIVVEGHTDNEGTPEANLRLSLERAESVRQALIALGLPPDQVGSAGYGDTRPVALNTTAEGRRQNRRVDFVFVSAEAQQPPPLDPPAPKVP
jgi:OOP family OmpA-OmpF porin